MLDSDLILKLMYVTFPKQGNLAKQIATIHNLAFYLWLVKEARKQIIAGNFTEWKKIMVKKVQVRL